MQARRLLLEKEPGPIRVVSPAGESSETNQFFDYNHFVSCALRLKALHQDSLFATRDQEGGCCGPGDREGPSTGDPVSLPGEHPGHGLRADRGRPGTRGLPLHTAGGHTAVQIVGCHAEVNQRGNTLDPSTGAAGMASRKGRAGLWTRNS